MNKKYWSKTLEQKLSSTVVLGTVGTVGSCVVYYLGEAVLWPFGQPIHAMHVIFLQINNPICSLAIFRCS